MNRRNFLEKFVALSSASLVLGESAVAEAIVVYGPPPMRPEPMRPVKPQWESFPPNLDNSSVIRDDIEYIELRKYIFDAKTDKQLSDKYLPYISIYTKNLSSYPPKRVSKFQKIPFGDTASPIITEMPSNSPLYKFKVKGFIIKTDGSFWTINEPKDIGWIFNGIDSPSKLYCFLKIYGLDSSNENNSFMKIDDGYHLVHTEIEHKFDGKVEYDMRTKYTYTIKSDGEFNKKSISSEIIKRNEKMKNSSTPHSIKELLKGEKFIYPLKKQNLLESEIKHGS